MSHVSAAALIFFQFPASKEVPFLAEGFGPNNWHSQSAGFWGKYPSAPPEDMGLLTQLWYLVAAVLMSWTPPEDWEQVEIMPVVLEVLSLTDQIPKDQRKAAGKVGWLLQIALKLQHCETLAQAAKIHRLIHEVTTVMAGLGDVEIKRQEKGVARPVTVQKTKVHLNTAARSLQQALDSWGWAVNDCKVQRPGLSVKFLGAVWLGKTKVIPEAVIDKSGRKTDCSREQGQTGTCEEELKPTTTGIKEEKQN
ncbi:uncharacterized protein LOC111828428 [Myotis lucifugus]|uniref:uncharacterized protein LOC111828428 n=1 Tax=Myotis lucifugus TaxID=59463 RepID=UPI000CCBDD09|nr:uncharacterized protein LOC111828428 [Myotis lucifugus]